MTSIQLQPRAASHNCTDGPDADERGTWPLHTLLAAPLPVAWVGPEGTASVLGCDDDGEGEPAWGRLDDIEAACWRVWDSGAYGRVSRPGRHRSSSSCRDCPVSRVQGGHQGAVSRAPRSTYRDWDERAAEDPYLRREMNDFDEWGA